MPQELTRHLKKPWMIALVLTMILGLALPLGSIISPQASVHAQDGGDVPLVNLNEENIKQATVFVMQTKDTPSGPVISCVGSGTLVSAGGLILTNAHLVEDTLICPTDRIVIALTLRIDETPVPTYVAEVVEFSRGLDLAVLRITSFLDGRLIDVGALKLPFVELGDSNAVQVDDTVLVVGYPDIGNDVVASVRATITGFTAEANYGERSWIRTSAEIPGLMSGGGMYDSDGRLIGIPTIAPARVAGTVLDCRNVYDTDGNGRLDDSDTCIPIGGAISAIRPSRLARGLVRAAALGIELGPERSPIEPSPIEGEPTFRRLIVSTGVNEAGMPISIISGAPSNVNSLYLFFDYRNMEDGLIYELRTTIDGRLSAIDSLPPVTWSGGRHGLWYIGGSRIPRPNGVYQFSLFIEGSQVATSDPIAIGGGPRDAPQFSDLIFGIENSSQELVGADYVIPEGNVIRARFNFRNMRPGLQWKQLWYLGDTLLQDITNEWANPEPQGSSNEASIVSEQGFPSGRYRLELYIIDNGQSTLSSTADFVVAGGAGGANDAEAQIFDNFRFAQDVRNTLPIGQVSESLPTETSGVFVFFNWRQLSPGTPWTWRWFVDGELLIERRTQWSTEPNGENYYLSLVGRPTLPDATYRFEIEMGGIILTQETQVRVGIGQLAVDAFASAEGVQLSGQIIDAETGQGIPGALFMVLLPEFSVEDFLLQERQLLGQAQADQNGFFQIPALLPRGTEDVPNLYSVMVRADGYLPLDADGIIVGIDTASPVVINVEMNRD